MTEAKHSPSDDLKERLLQLIRNPSKLCLTSDEGWVVLARIQALEAQLAVGRKTAIEAARRSLELKAQLAEADATIEAFGRVSPQQYEKEVASLKTELAEARKALEPFAAAFNKVPGRDRDLEGIDEFKIERVLYLQDQPDVGDFRRADAVIHSKD